MKEHSREFLEKQSTEYLDKVLNALLTSEMSEQKADTVRLILKILNEREKDIHAERTPEMDTLWIRCLEDCARDRVLLRDYKDIAARNAF